MTAELTPSRVAELLAATASLVEAEIAALREDGARWHPAPGAWCVNEVAGHLIEAEKRGFAGRIRTILAEDRPVLQAWDQAGVARERRDCERLAQSLWMEFMGLRKQSVELVRRLKPAELERSGVHPKVGELRVRDLLHEWVHHDRNHTKQILSNAQARVWPYMGNAQKFSDE